MQVVVTACAFLGYNRCNDQEQHYDHWQVKWMTLIISSSWQLLVGGIYYEASEYFVFWKLMC